MSNYYQLPNSGNRREVSSCYVSCQLPTVLSLAALSQKRGPFLCTHSHFLDFQGSRLKSRSLEFLMVNSYIPSHKEDVKDVRGLGGKINDRDSLI